MQFASDNRGLELGLDESFQDGLNSVTLVKIVPRISIDEGTEQEYEAWSATKTKSSQNWRTSLKSQSTN